MDFTSSFRHSSNECITYSPGSTFLAFISGSPPRTLLIRASSTLQVIRSWDFDHDIHSIQWSKDGFYLIAASHSKDENGAVYILSLDPSKEAKDGSDDHQGWVAKIEPGSEGLAASTWGPTGGPPTVINFSQNFISMTLYSLPQGVVSTVQGPKKSQVFQCPKRPKYFALIASGNERDSLQIFASKDSKTQDRFDPDSEPSCEWELERAFPLLTNDVADASWSPDGRFFAVWESSLEYKLLIYTPLGHLRSTFYIDPNSASEPTTRAPHLDATSPSIGASNQRKKKEADEFVVAGGGLGIKHVSWHPSGDFLAIAGYDEKIRFLENQEWTEFASVDLSKRTLMPYAPNLSVKSHGRLIAWREPGNWMEDTGGGGIVPFEVASLPTSIAVIRVDDSKPNPKLGVKWMRWSPDGDLIASRDERMPFTIFIHSFALSKGSNPSAKPYLLSVLFFSAPVSSASWKSGHSGKLGVVCGSNAVYFWELLEKRQGGWEQRAEAVPIPNDDFAASNVAWSPDGQKLLLWDHESFCCAFEALDGEDHHFAEASDSPTIESDQARMRAEELSV
ncbi:WD40 repeat-like protein [Violaceomyces palustris]|uniref:WD40 repeat-like protein n=1 Tax=Violaceomyces palustris TaxID=1673888 RepID=A0ACD0NYK8_9BASI|nr:WD40 repeat-like protein [Violaceomyces palustris]